MTCMEIVKGILVVVHMIGWAMVLGGALATMKSPKVTPGMLHGALAALVAGILTVGVVEMADGDVNNVKIGIKLAITLVITVLVILGRRKESVSAGYLGGLAGLVVANIAIAVLW